MTTIMTMTTLEKLRPEIKPAQVSDSEWGKSKCDKSPTGSHWFVQVQENSNKLRCRFCGKSYTAVWSTGQWPKKDKTKSSPDSPDSLDSSGKKLGRPRKTHVE